MNVDDEVELNRILMRIVPDSLTKVLGAFRLPQYTLYAKKEWHLGFVRLNFTPKGEQRPSANWRRRSHLRYFHVVMGVGVGVERCLI